MAVSSSTEAPSVERRLDVDSRRVVLLDTGQDREATPLILLHGIGSSARSFLPVLPLLAADRRVIAPNHPGYGGSDTLGLDKPTADDWAAFLWRVLESAGVREQVHLCGHSLGCLIATAAALREPERVASLTLIDPGLGHAAPPDGPWPASVIDRLAVLERDGAAAYAAGRAARLCAPNASPDAISAVEREMARLTVGGLGGGCSVLAQGDLVAMLQRSPVKPQFVTGDEDRIVPIERVRAAADALSAPLDIMTGVGHAGYIEAPARYAAAIGKVVD